MPGEMAKKSEKKQQVVEAVISDELNKKFTYWCKINGVSKRTAAGEAIQLFMDYKQYNFKQLQDHENSPLWVKLNQILEQEELNGQLSHELQQTIEAMVNTLLGTTGQLRESGDSK